MADRWDKRDLENSRYIWLPLRMEKAKPVIRWEDAWRPDLMDRTAGNRGLPK
jgi:beta-galactosidase